ncbi:MAG: rRNA maturation RNase YbeY [Thiobacillus sp.]|nr:rRNA maturation RNase YbeY [Thiobacillus sp.]
MPNDTAPMLDLTVQYAVAKDGLPTRAQFRRWAKAAQAHDVVATLRIVDAEEGQALNRDYRGKDYATNVLTFEYGADASMDGAPLTGDIVLCAPVVAREATEQGKDLAAHYAHLVVHGMLHLQGYDHEVEAEAAVMEAVESFVMMRMGFPDPYLDHE